MTGSCTAGILTLPCTWACAAVEWWSFEVADLGSTMKTVKGEVRYKIRADVKRLNGGRQDLSDSHNRPVEPLIDGSVTMVSTVHVSSLSLSLRVPLRLRVFNVCRGELFTAQWIGWRTEVPRLNRSNAVTVGRWHRAMASWTQGVTYGPRDGSPIPFVASDDITSSSTDSPFCHTRVACHSSCSHRAWAYHCTDTEWVRGPLSCCCCCCWLLKRCCSSLFQRPSSQLFTFDLWQLLTLSSTSPSHPPPTVTSHAYWHATRLCLSATSVQRK